MKTTVFKRRTLFIKKHFQGRFLLGSIAIILLSGFCSAFLIYLIVNGDLHAQSLSAHVKIASASERLWLSILVGNLVSLFVAGAISIISALYFSHKIAGPLYRLENQCKKIGAGQFVETVNLRPADLLQELAQAFNAMTSELRLHQEKQTQQLQQMYQLLEELQSSENLSDAQKQTLAALLQTCAKLQRQPEA